MRLLRRLLDWRVIVGILVVGMAALLGGVSIVSSNEQNDNFCVSCHTEPESTYFARFQSAMTGRSQDLAAYHHRQLYPRNSPAASNIRCIDCHVGEGLVGRGIVVSLAGWDALKYVTGTATQPAKVVFTIQNDGCVKCHDQQVKVNLDKPVKPFVIDNHFHYKLFEKGAPFESCVACHVSHREGTETNAFQFRDVIIPVCEDCHRRENKGPIKMQ
jgi:nitrate/TMAO reductase-like tetraheme cytochrome c subunit